MIEPPAKKTKADGGWRHVRRWWNELHDWMMRSRVRPISGWTETPTGLIPPPVEKLPSPPLYPLLFREGAGWKWSITPGLVIARDGVGNQFQERHIPLIGGRRVSARTVTANGQTLKTTGPANQRDNWIYLEIDYGAAPRWLDLCQAQFLVGSSVPASTKCIQRIGWAEVVYQEGLDPRLDYKRAMFGHYVAQLPNRGNCDPCPSVSSSSSASASASASSSGGGGSTSSGGVPADLCIVDDATGDQIATVSTNNVGFGDYNSADGRWALSYDEQDAEWVLYDNGIAVGTLGGANPVGDYGDYTLLEGECSSSSSSSSSSADPCGEAICVTFPDTSTMTMTWDGDAYTGDGGYSVSEVPAAGGRQWVLWDLADRLSETAVGDPVDAAWSNGYSVVCGPCPVSSSSSSSAGSGGGGSGGGGSGASASSSSSAAPPSSGSGGGSIKASWILPVEDAQGRTEHVALSPVEAPIEKFTDVYEVPVDAMTGVGHERIDPYFLQVCEDDSVIAVSVMPLGAPLMGGQATATVAENVLTVQVPAVHRWRRGQTPNRYRVVIEGLKRDGAGRWVKFSRAQAEANAAWYRRAYDTGNE